MTDQSTPTPTDELSEAFSREYDKADPFDRGFIPSGTAMVRVVIAAGWKSPAEVAELVRAGAETALHRFAELLRERYPEDVFAPISTGEHADINQTLGDFQVPSRDRISADMMRRAAAQADREADEYSKPTPDTTEESNV